MPHPEELQALVNQGVMPENLELEPLSEFIPIASSSSQSAPEDVKVEPVVVSEESVDAVQARSLKSGGKRKSQDEVGSSTPSGKKRKLRNKRVKV